MTTNLPKLVVLLGPTASGKSGLGITLAQHFNGEIVSADSRQVYRGLDIGTAKVTRAEQALVPHHMLDVADPREIYTVAQYQQDAIRVINDILSRNHQPFLVGGSPHYIQAVVDNLDIPQIEPQPELRAQLEKRPLADLMQQLEELDPRTAATIDRNNPRRVIRALEVCLVSGQPFSTQSTISEPLYQSLLLGIAWPRETLYRRIDERVDARMRQGMIQEVQRLLDEGTSHQRLDALGLEYRYISRWLTGAFKSKDEMTQRLKYAIHDFTRRQLTWFRKEKRIIWVNGGDWQRAKDVVKDFLTNGVMRRNKR
jgi:tRNA dimethylallyltransferase